MVKKCQKSSFRNQKGTQHLPNVKSIKDDKPVSLFVVLFCLVYFVVQPVTVYENWME